MSLCYSTLYKMSADISGIRYIIIFTSFNDLEINDVRLSRTVFAHCYTITFVCKSFDIRQHIKFCFDAIHFIRILFSCLTLEIDCDGSPSRIKCKCCLASRCFHCMHHQIHHILKTSSSFCANLSDSLRRNLNLLYPPF